jgi:hypothetical protein
MTDLDRTHPSLRYHPGTLTEGGACMDMTRVESRGSFWWFNEATKHYLRTPKEEAPRLPEWSKGALADLSWHQYEAWFIAHEPFGVHREGGRTLFRCAPETLVIRLPDSESSIYAPDAHICDHG